MKLKEDHELKMISLLLKAFYFKDLNDDFIFDYIDDKDKFLNVLMFFILTEMNLKDRANARTKEYFDHIIKMYQQVINCQTFKPIEWKSTIKILSEIQKDLGIYTNNTLLYSTQKYHCLTIKTLFNIASHGLTESENKKTIDYAWNALTIATDICENVKSQKLLTLLDKYC